MTKRRYKKSEREILEPQLAASMLYYDKDQFEIFNTLWRSIENEPDLSPSGNFSAFVNTFKEYVDSFENYKPDKIGFITYLRQIMNTDSNKDRRIRFEEWVEQVLVQDTPATFELGEELFYHYSWLCYQDTVLKVDESDTPFKEKLLIRPTSINYTEKEKIFVKITDKIEAQKGKAFTTGYDELDNYLEPQSSNLMIIAGRPGDGKSTLMLSQALENAREGKKVLFISAEMTHKQLQGRVYNWYRNTIVSPTEYKEIEKEKEFQEFNENITFIINQTNNAATILNLMKESVRKRGVEAVFVDYLQIIRFDRMDEWASLRELTFALKRFGTSEGVLVVAASQVSRESESYGISLGSMFGSASIEADADIVCAIQAKDSNAVGHSRYKSAVISILKNRDGVRDVHLDTNVDYACLEFLKK